MRRTAVLVAATLLVVPSVAPGSAQTQTPPKRTPEQLRASFDTHKGEFDYLLGDWEFTAESKEHGKFRGYWSAVRLDEGQILDEYRVVGDNGETFYVTTSLRNYNSVLDRWELVGADAGSGVQDFGTGRKVGAEMHIEQRFGVASGSPSLWRIRYFDIRPDRFSWSADRSPDNGKTWVEKHQTIEARRIGPPRPLGPLAGPKPKRGQSPAAGEFAGTWSGTWTSADAGSGGFELTLVKGEKGGITGKVSVTGEPAYEAELKTVSFDERKMTAQYDFPPDERAEVILTATFEGNKATGAWSLREAATGTEVAAGGWSVSRK